MSIGWKNQAVLDGHPGIEYFFGQTQIYIPKPLSVNLSKAQIENAVANVFGEQEMEKFHMTYRESDEGTMIEVPPVLEAGRGISEVNAATQLVNLLEHLALNCSSKK